MDDSFFFNSIVQQMKTFLDENPKIRENLQKPEHQDQNLKDRIQALKAEDRGRYERMCEILDIRPYN